MALLACGVATASAADPSPLPFASPAKHMGVASCAGSTCHGAIAPWTASTIRQDEYVMWLDQDPHARAYKVLMSEQSERIARNLGLKNAYEAEICLDCHTDNVPPEQRGSKFQITDGVGCESCHGGAEHWLASHVTGKSNHEDNIAAGLYPTDDGIARAKLCLSCHFGDENRIITHRIMGAGHPRLRFELDTFTVTQPAHYTVDSDYTARKAAASHVKTWAIGQVMAVDALLDGMLDPHRSRDGIFPELVFFDCHACHHLMSDKRWQPRDDSAIGPGIPRIADANIIMLATYLEQVDPTAAAEFEMGVKALHQATSSGYEAMDAAAQTLKSVTSDLAARISATDMNSRQIQGLLTAIIDRGLRGTYTDYAVAEQAIMAISSIVDTMRNTNVLSPAEFKDFTRVLEKCYAAVEKDEGYDPLLFASALQEVRTKLPPGE